MANVIAPNVPASQAFPFEREIESWTLESALEEIKPKVESYKRSAQELAKELFIAHEALARRGGDNIREGAERFTWSDFCDLIGLSRKMAGGYIMWYDPEHDRVRDPEEMKALKSANIPQLSSESEARIAKAMETGIRDAGWTDADEREYKKRMENKRFSELAEKWGNKQIRWTRKSDRDYFAEAMANAKKYTRFSLETKEQTKAQFEIYDLISQYLATFTDPGVRLQASYNLGLKIRDIVNELASNETEMDSFDADDDNDGEQEDNAS